MSGLPADLDELAAHLTARVAPPQPEDFPYDRDPVEFQKANAAAERLSAALTAAVGVVSLSIDAQDCSNYAIICLPQSVRREHAKDNNYLVVRLSKIDRLAAIHFEWDLEDDARERIIEVIEESGFKYVPFAVFADPVHYNWKDIYNCHFHSIKLPPGMGEMHRSELWSNLFDYY